jgi:hypothetical protein
VVDQFSRSAVKIATLVAVPVGVVAGIVAFVVLAGVLGGRAGPAPSPPAPSPPAPVATAPVALAERDLGERERTACRALLSQLPGSVRDLAQRPVTAGPEQNAAFGDPPITLECGVPRAGFAPTDQVWRVDDVCWYPSDEGTTLVTVDREVPVRVRVPDPYGAPLQWAAEFSGSIASTILSLDQPPSGCNS